MLPHQQERPVDPPGVLKQRYVTAASLLAWGAYAALVYVVLVRGLQLARDTAFPLVIGKIGWGEIDPPLSIWFPLFPVAFALALLLPLATKYCIAFIVSIKGKDPLSRWAKGILIVITLACIVSTLTATGPLMIESYSGKYREAAVKGELVEARLTAEKQIYADMQQSLQTMKDGKSVEAAAAREGVAGWSAKVAIAKKQLEAGQLDQARYDRIERASSTAAAREDLERQMREQQVKIASLPTASTAVSMVKSDESHGAQEFAEVSSAYWPMSSFFALEMIAVFFGLIELVLMLTRDRQLADWAAVNAAPVPEPGIDLRLEDQTNIPQPNPGEVQMFEEPPGSGIMVEKIFVRTGYKEDGVTPHGYWRQLPKKKTKGQEEIDAAAAAKDAGKRNASDWYVKNETSMFDGLPEDGQNPQSEVSDEDARASEEYNEPNGPVHEAAEGSDQSIPDGAPEVREGEGENSLNDEEDQQAVPGVSDEVGTAEFEPDETASSGDEWDREFADERSDEGARLVDADDRDEVVIEETLLPNNEGVLVGTPIIPDDEAEALNEQLMARRAAAEAAE